MPSRPFSEPLRNRVAAYLRRHQLVRAGDRVGVAVSGGADSTALLRLLLELRSELGLVLCVVHFHHGIRGAEADADEQFVRALTDHHGLVFHRGSGDAPEYARSHGLSLETAARELRYSYFRQLLSAGMADKIATAHTRDDQAETVLLRLLRGTGNRGLAGIYPRLRWESAELAAAGPQPEGTARMDLLQSESARIAGEIVRPLLEISRKELEQYLRDLRQSWREDTSNLDVKHARNRVRHVLLPLLEREFNPAVREVLGETAEIARAEEEFWRPVVDQARAGVVIPNWSTRPGSAIAGTEEYRVSAERMRELPAALQRRVLRAMAEELGLSLDFGHVEAVLAMMQTRREARIALPDNWIAEQDLLRLPRDSGPARAQLVLRRRPLGGHAKNYHYVLPIPGEVRVKELGVRFRASLVPLTDSGSYNRYELLDPRCLEPELAVRNWRAGDRFWPAHTHSARKIKELLQARHISGCERALWPVAINSAGEIVWMRGFAVPERLSPGPNAERAVWIQEEVLSTP